MADHQTGLGGIYAEDPTVRKIVDNADLSAADAARRIHDLGIATSERAVNRLRAKVQPTGSGPAETVAPTGKADITPDSVTFHGVVLDQSLQGETDWSRIFAIFQLDPAHFRIVDDTVKISTWQQSKGTEDGGRDFIQLWSHSARFSRRADSDLPEDIVERWRTALIEGPKPMLPLAGKGTYALFVSDPQLGKKGTDEAVENWKRGVTEHIEEIRALEDSGAPVAAIHVGFQGDETEGVANNYGNQSHTIELNQSQQLELDYDLRMWTLRECLDLGLPVTASSVISNHGEWTRNGSKDVVTTKNDNASTHIARQVKKTFEALEPFGIAPISWTIGNDAPGIVVNLSGVDCYMSHGYIEKGRGSATEIRTKNAIERQVLGNIDSLGSVPLWFMSHYHHYYAQEFEGKTLFGLPALEALRSSEYMQHQFGVWSPPGLLGLVVGRDLTRGWSNLSIH